MEVSIEDCRWQNPIRSEETVFADLAAKRVLFGVEGRDAGVWEAPAPELGAHHGHPTVPVSTPSNGSGS
jgi:hypothetical protein